MGEFVSRTELWTEEGLKDQKISGNVELEHSNRNGSENNSNWKGNFKGFRPMIGVVEVLGLLPVSLIIYWAFSRNGGLVHYALKMSNWHVILSSISYVYLIGNAILTFRILRNWPKSTRKMVHAFVAGVNGVLAVASVWAAFTFHDRSAIADLYSVHSWIGIITLIMYMLQLFGGLFVFLYPGLSFDNRASFMPYHKFVGQVTFALAIAATMTGINEKAIFKLGKCYEEKTFEGVLLNLCSILFTLFGVFVVYIVANSPYKKDSTRADDLAKPNHAE